MCPHNEWVNLYGDKNKKEKFNIRHQLKGLCIATIEAQIMLGGEDASKGKIELVNKYTNTIIY